LKIWDYLFCEIDGDYLQNLDFFYIAILMQMRGEIMLANNSSIMLSFCKST